MNSRILGEDIIILTALFVDLVFSPIYPCSFPKNISSFVVSEDGIRRWGFLSLYLQVL